MNEIKSGFCHFQHTSAIGVLINVYSSVRYAHAWASERDLTVHWGRRASKEIITKPEGEMSPREVHETLKEVMFQLPLHLKVNARTKPSENLENLLQNSKLGESSSSRSHTLKPYCWIC